MGIPYHRFSALIVGSLATGARLRYSFGMAIDEAEVERLAAQLGLGIDPASRAAVARNLEVLLQAARLVAEFPLPEETEPAPRFEP